MSLSTSQSCESHFVRWAAKEELPRLHISNRHTPQTHKRTYMHYLQLFISGKHFIAIGHLWFSTFVAAAYGFFACEVALRQSSVWLTKWSADTCFSFMFKNFLHTHYEGPLGVEESFSCALLRMIFASPMKWSLMPYSVEGEGQKVISLPNEI